MTKWTMDLAMDRNGSGEFLGRSVSSTKLQRFFIFFHGFSINNPMKSNEDHSSMNRPAPGRTLIR